MGRTKYQPSGFTLIELLIVLAVLAMLAGLAVPRLFGVLSKSRVQQAARQVADELNTARVLAITHGCPYELRIASDGTQYTIRPKHAADPSSLDAGQDPFAVGGSTDVLGSSQPNNLNSSVPSQLAGSSLREMSAAGGGSFSGGSELNAKPRPKPELIDGELGNGVVFGNAQLSALVTVQIPFALPSADQQLSPINSEEITSDIGLSNTTWQSLAIFYPDGRAETASITLIGDDGRSIELTVRGLTGAVRIGPTQRPATKTDNATQDDLFQDDTMPPTEPTDALF